jgi:hypothetical protein
MTCIRELHLKFTQSTFTQTHTYRLCTRGFVCDSVFSLTWPGVRSKVTNDHVRRVLACLPRWSGRVVVIAASESLRISPLTHTSIAKFSTHNMAGFKRGGSVGSAGKPIKKARAIKRAASNDEDSPPRNTKKSKGEDNKPAPLAPELNEDDDGRPYISVSSRLCLHAASLTY